MRLASRLLDRRQEAGRGHWEVSQADADGGVDGVGDGRHGRDDRHLARSAHPEGMPRIRHLDQHRVDHRQVRGHRDAIIEETRILQAPVRGWTAKLNQPYKVTQPRLDFRTGAVVLSTRRPRSLSGYFVE